MTFRDGLERIQVPEGATVETLKRQITENLNVPVEDMTLSTNKDLVGSGIYCQMTACVLHTSHILTMQAHVLTMLHAPRSSQPWTRAPSQTWPGIGSLWHPFTFSMGTW